MPRMEYEPAILTLSFLAVGGVVVYLASKVWGIKSVPVVAVAMIVIPTFTTIAGFALVALFFSVVFG